MRTVYVKNIPIGDNHPIVIQSMTNTKTKNVSETIEQIKKLEASGAQIVRLAVADMEDAEAIKEIKKSVSVPLVADIHFDYRLALKAIENGIDKLRLNPGNIKDKAQITQVVLACKDKKIPIRIGIKDLPDKPNFLKIRSRINASVASATRFLSFITSSLYATIILFNTS